MSHDRVPLKFPDTENTVVIFLCKIYDNIDFCVL